jgi:hypothetical protein
MNKKFIILTILVLLFGTTFGQFQIPLHAPGNSAGLISDNNFSFLSVIGQNTIGVASDGNNKAYFGLLAPVRFVLTDITIVRSENIQLFQNYPNPYKIQTTIPFEISSPLRVKLTVFDVFGRNIKQLLDQEMPQGKHLVPFDAKNIGPGLYLFRLEAGGFVATKNMVLTH